MNLQYNPLLKKYKSVTGAVEVGQAFSVCVESDADAVSLMMRKEGEWESVVEYEMACLGQGFFVELKITSPGLYRYYFTARKQGKACDFYADAELSSAVEGDRWVLLAYESAYDLPTWLEGGLIYQIFPDRFFDGNARIKSKKNMLYREDWGGVPTYQPNKDGIVENKDMFGGNLYGVAKKLDYLQSLGVTCIYLNPIFEAASNHKYDTGSYRRVDGDFGGENALRELISEANKRNIRIVLDGVFSHTGADSVYFNKYGNYDSVGAYASKDSPYHDWYRFESFPDKYECWWGIKILPNVDELSASYDEFINGEDGIIRTYLRMGISGWRLDVADELPDGFLNNLTKSAKKERSDALVLGEVWEDAATKCAYGKLRPYFWGKQLDSVTNYPLKEGILHFVRTADASKLRQTVANLVDHYPSRSLNLLMNVIDTHDTARAITALARHEDGLSKQGRSVAKCVNYPEAVRKLMLAACLQYFLPGVPCLYYGDEAGMQGFEDPFNRKCYPWGEEDKALIDFYKRLGALRAEYRQVLSDGEYELICSKERVFAFTRSKQGRALTVMVNAGAEEVALESEVTDLITQKQYKSLKGLTCLVFYREI